MTNDFPFIRLNGTRRGFFRKATLWEGADYLLSVRGTRFNEEYRRYYYRDIEALIVEDCARAGSIGAWIVSVILLAIAIGIVANSSKPVALAALCVVVAFILVRLAVSLRYSCRCVIQTAVSRDELPSLIRKWAAAKTIPRIRQRILAAQGSLPEDLSGFNAQSSVAEVQPLAAEERSEESAKVSAEQKAALQRKATRGVDIAIAVFFTLLANGIFAFWYVEDLAGGTLWVRLASLGLIIAETALAVAALLFIYRLTVFNALRSALAVVLAFAGLQVTIAAYLAQLYSIDHGAVTLSISTFKFVHGWSMLDGGFELALGMAGLVLILLKWDTYRRGAPSSS